MERKIRELLWKFLYVSCRLSQPTVPMNKLLQTKTGDTFPIYVGEGIEVLIEDQLVFLSELGELSGQADSKYQAKIKQITNEVL